MSATAFTGFAAAQLNFRLLIDAAADAIVVTKRDGRIVLVNTQTEKLFGYPLQELVGRKVEVLIPQRVRRRFVKNRQLGPSRRGEQITSASVELYGLRKDGTEFPIDVIFSPVEASGEVLVASSIRDISKRKRAEERVSHLAAIVEASDDAIIAASLDGKITSWNPGAERLYGYKAEEVIGQPLSLLVPAGRADEIARFTKALLRGEHVEHYEITKLHKDGHLVETSVTISPVKDREGAVIGVSATARDITRQKRAEEAVRQSEERFRVALKTAPVAVFNQDQKLRYTWVNSPALAWGKKEYLGHTDAEIFGYKEGARLTAIKREVLHSGIGTRTETEVTFQGETHYLDLAVEPLRDVRGILLGLTSSATDITPIKKTLLERERLIAKMKGLLEEVKLLSGLLSICTSCKKILSERGDWVPLEGYLQTHSQARFLHGLCPDCLRKLYPEQPED